MTLAQISARIRDPDQPIVDSAAGAAMSGLRAPTPKRVPVPPSDGRTTFHSAGAESGAPIPITDSDKVNRFLLCVLVIDSAKKIKMRALDLGEDLPLTTVIRGVLESYNDATAKNRVSLAGSDPNVWSLTRLNDGVLNDELRRHMMKQVKRRQAQLDYAHRLGDAPRIKVQEEALAHATAARDHLAREVS
jgi:hypothetical protein